MGPYEVPISLISFFFSIFIITFNIFLPPFHTKPHFISFHICIIIPYYPISHNRSKFHSMDSISCHLAIYFAGFDLFIYHFHSFSCMMLHFHIFSLFGLIFQHNLAHQHPYGAIWPDMDQHSLTFLPHQPPVFTIISSQTLFYLLITQISLIFTEFVPLCVILILLVIRSHMTPYGIIQPIMALVQLDSRRAKKHPSFYDFKVLKLIIARCQTTYANVLS